MANLSSLLRILGDTVTAWRSSQRPSQPPVRHPAPGNQSRPARPDRAASSTTGGVPAPFSGGYPGDFVGVPHFSYAPHNDDLADPGEIVWTWVPFEEDVNLGKDRPVLLLGFDGAWLLGAPLTSKDHDRDAAQEASQGRYWMDIGTGDWDAQHRASEVRLNRVIRVSREHVRRTSGRLDAALFSQVTQAISAHLSR